MRSEPHARALHREAAPERGWQILGGSLASGIQAITSGNESKQGGDYKGWKVTNDFDGVEASLNII